MCSFCRTRRKQDDSLHTQCVNLHMFVFSPIIVEIWRTFFGALGASAMCSFSFSLLDVFHTVSWCCFVGSPTSGTLSETSCDSTCESYRCMYLSLDVRLNIHVARSVGLTLFVTVALLFETLLQALQKPFSSSKEMRSLDAKSLVLTSSKATRPTFIESFFVVRRGGGLPSRILTLRDWCEEQRLPLGPHAWNEPQRRQLPAAS